jgi:hypothetical protein
MRPTRRTLLGTFGLLTVAAGAALEAAPAPEPKPDRVTCKLRKEEDRAEIKYEPGALVLTIVCKSGIGGAVVDTGGTKAPPRLVLRFPGLRSMEGFKIHDGTVSLEGRVGLGGERSLHLFDGKGKEVKEAKEAVYRLELDHAAKADLIEVTLTYPAEARDGRKWKVEWVDAYRG